jgi:hypothetical protein
LTPWARRIGGANSIRPAPAKALSKPLLVGKPIIPGMILLHASRPRKKRFAKTPDQL